MKHKKHRSVKRPESHGLYQLYTQNEMHKEHKNCDPELFLVLFHRCAQY